MLAIVPAAMAALPFVNKTADYTGIVRSAFVKDSYAVVTARRGEEEPVVIRIPVSLPIITEKGVHGAENLRRGDEITLCFREAPVRLHGVLWARAEGAVFVLPWSRRR